MNQRDKDRYSIEAQIELPPIHYDELPGPDDAVPAMLEYGRRAVLHDRQQRGEPVAEVLAWRERFPSYEYRPQDECVALKLKAPQPAEPSGAPTLHNNDSGAQNENQAPQPASPADAALNHQETEE